MYAKERGLTLKAVTVLVRLLLRLFKRKYYITEVIDDLIDRRLLGLAFKIKEWEGKHVGGLVHTSEFLI